LFFQNDDLPSEEEEGSDVSPPPTKQSRQDLSQKKVREEVEKAGPDQPVDLASYYSVHGVDLQTLSELTGSVMQEEEDEIGTSRSKRTCVRVREEISKLQEMLDTGGGAVKAGIKGQSVRGRGGTSTRGLSGMYNIQGAAQRSRTTRTLSTSQRKRSRKQSEEGLIFVSDLTTLRN